MTFFFAHDPVGARLVAILEEHGIEARHNANEIADWFESHREFLPEGMGPLEAMCRAGFEAVIKDLRAQGLVGPKGKLQLKGTLDDEEAA